MPPVSPRSCRRAAVPDTARGSACCGPGLLARPGVPVSRCPGVPVSRCPGAARAVPAAAVLQHRGQRHRAGGTAGGGRGTGSRTGAGRWRARRVPVRPWRARRDEPPPLSIDLTFHLLRHLLLLARAQSQRAQADSNRLILDAVGR
uniref:Corticotropin-releasing factor domain-containing protein n=1 Tax=Anas zonorhyncha TaxID=75864 RepID=A0A8B9UXW6_9AVES